MSYSKEYYERNREKIRTYMRAYHIKNREMQCEKKRVYAAANKNKIRDQQRKKNGLPIPTRPEPPVCECCGQPPTSRKRLHLDHCHITGKFRGWLCTRCNPGIGFMKDSVEILTKAIEYLKRAELY